MTNKITLGSIIARKNGRTPMRVIDVRGTVIRAAYLNHTSAPDRKMIELIDVVVELPMTGAVLVTAPKKQLAQGYEKRLAGNELAQLGRQILACEEEEETMENEITLYQTNEATPRFGTKLAVNSAGKIVLEMKGSGNVEAFDKDAVSVVMPYTVDVTFQGGGGNYAFRTLPGEVEVGDLLALHGYDNFATVVAIDTKSPKATKDLVGRRILTAKLDG